jgi:hypothetical protein
MSPHLRPDVALIQWLLVAGVLPVTALQDVEIRHGPDCPMRSARSTTCRCEPQVWLAGAQVTA